MGGTARLSNAGIFTGIRYEELVCFYEGGTQYGVGEKLLKYGAFGLTPRYHALVDPPCPPAPQSPAWVKGITERRQDREWF